MPTFRTSQGASTADPTLPHIVLVGLPGSGKSTVGAMLAQHLGRTFLDFDQEIARRQGMSVAEIFAQLGEPHFRQLERTLTVELLETGNMILSPGGGWITQADTMSLLRPHATLVHLKLRPRAALRRMGSKYGTRPLLAKADPLGELERLWQERSSAYAVADVTVDVERIAPQQVIERIVAELDARR